MRKKKSGFRRLTAGLLAFFVCVFLALASLFAYQMPAMFPSFTLAVAEGAAAFFDGVALPIRMARLSLMEPDVTLEMPVYGVKISSVSDSWHAPRGADRQHEGQDIFASRGTPVFSATDGYIRRIGVGTLGGNFVYVTGAGMRRYYYAHLSEFAAGLRIGQEVSTGTVLGFVGNTGNAVTTPPHLHFGIYQSRTAINPHPLLVDR